jgi:hypothetical protein
MREQKRIVIKAKTNLWKVLREIIRADCELLKDKFQRDSYCIVRDLMASELGKRIAQEGSDWFLTDRGFSTYRDDVWTSPEQKEGLQRPEARPQGAARSTSAPSAPVSIAPFPVAPSEPPDEFLCEFLSSGPHRRLALQPTSPRPAPAVRAVLRSGGPR